VAPLFARSCLAGCHDATTAQAGLDLASPNVGERLYGKQAQGRPDYFLIDPELPEESALVVKLTAKPPFGSSMPLGGTAFTEAERACVAKWAAAVVAEGPSDAGTGVDAGGNDAGPSDGGSDAGVVDAGHFWGPAVDSANCVPDGGVWCVDQVVPEPLYAVRGVSATDVWAVGARGAAWHFDGATWQRSDAGTTSTLFDVHPVSADDVWAVGEQGLVLHFHQGAWSVASWAPNTALDAGLPASGQPTWDFGGVWATDSDVWVAGGGGTLAHSTGGAFQVVQSSPHSSPAADFAKLWRRDDTEWWAGGNLDFHEWDGVSATWSPGKGAIASVFGLWGSTVPATGEKVLVAVGTDAALLQFSYTDTGSYPWQPPSWNRGALELARDLRSVWLDDAAKGWTVGLDGELVQLNFATHQYTRHVSPTSDHLLGVWGVGVHQAWARRWASAGCHPQVAVRRARSSRTMDAAGTDFFARLKAHLVAQPSRSLEAKGLVLKEAAVLAPLFWRGGEPWAWLTRRPMTLRKHPGQISFPGGGRDEGDLTPLHTALRETKEELGIDPSQVEVLGMLGSMPTITSFWVTPFVGVVPADVTLTPSAHEIDEVIAAPLWRLRREQRVIYQAPRDVFVWEDARHVVWGATWRMLDQLMQHVDAVGRG
jgi:8-oxo-dGTP pyrophosphatase MutT (NUDIX family)